MFLCKRVGTTVAQRKKSEHLLRRNEWHTQPRAQMGKTLECGPFCLYRRVRDEQTVPAGKNVDQKLAVFCIEGRWGFRGATTRLAPLHLSGKEETGIRLHQQDAR